jgi:hypothetical protein
VWGQEDWAPDMQIVERASDCGMVRMCIYEVERHQEYNINERLGEETSVGPVLRQTTFTDPGKVI